MQSEANQLVALAGGQSLKRFSADNLFVEPGHDLEPAYLQYAPVASGILLLACRVNRLAENAPMHNSGLSFGLVLILIFLAPRLLPAAAGDTNAAWLAEHYTKYEHRIPMRDGVRLFTRVYVPKDDSQAWLIIITRTPYALKPYGTDNYTDPSGSFRTLAKDRFILVSQDVRGRYGSEGEYVQLRPFNPN